MSGLLLDTHIWYWKLTDDPALPARLSRRLDRDMAECWLSPISLWEIAMLHRKKRIALKKNAREWTEQALERAPIREAPLSFEVAHTAEGLLHIGDPADTLIAATALTYDLTLVTVDEELQEVKGLRTLSS